MTEQIKITNQTAGSTTIEIEGVIGVPEKWQFENPEQRVATYETFRKKVEEIKRLDAKEIVVNIRSTGGNVNDALLIFDALQGLGSKVITRCYGYVASAATIIAQAASEGQREISGNSLYLIHRSVCSAEGNSKELEKTLDMLGKTDQRIAEVYAGRSGKDVNGFVTLMSENNGAGRWLAPNEVVELGLADKMIEASPIKADARKTLLNLGLPPVPKNRKAIGGEIVRQWNTMLEKMGLPVNKTAREDESTLAVANKDSAAAKERTVGHKATETKIVEALGTIEDSVNLSSEIEAERTNNVETKNMSDAEDRKNAVKATSTKSKEDPSPQELRFSQNEEAYLNDLRRFI